LVDHLTEFVLVAQHVHCAVSRGQGHRAVWFTGPGCVHRVGGQHEQVDVGDVQGPLVIEPREQQQIVDKDAHPGRLGLDPAGEHLDLSGRAGTTAAIELREPADRRQRSTQLV
jgi:hypothetical protein